MPTTTPLPSADYGATLRAAIRLVLFLSYTFASVPVHWVYRKFHPDQPFRIPRLFHTFLLKIIGFRLRVHGAMTLDSPVLFVANHTSYMDIPILGSLLPAAFVAKSEVGSWPFFGFMARLQQTVFVERQIMRTGEHKDALRDRLAQNQSLILFPEGTSSDGQSVLPFKSSFFAVAEAAARDIALTVQPISVTCSEFDGLPITHALRPLYAWYGDMTLVGHIWTLFKIGHVTVDVVFHPALAPRDFPNRKALAAACQGYVANGVEDCITGRLMREPKPPLPPSLTKN